MPSRRKARYKAAKPLKHLLFVLYYISIRRMNPTGGILNKNFNILSIAAIMAFLLCQPVMGADPGLEVSMPFLSMPFAPGYGIDGISPVFYTPSGFTYGGTLWYAGATTDRFDNDSVQYNGFSLGLKAGYSLKFNDYDDHPQLGGVFGTDFLKGLFPVDGYRMYAASLYAGIEYAGRTETIPGTDSSGNKVAMLAGTENAARPYLEVELKTEYVLDNAWASLSRLIFWNWNELVLGVRCYYNIPSKNIKILNSSLYTKYTTDPMYSYSERPFIRNFESYYSGNTPCIEMSVYVKYLCLALYWEKLPNKVMYTMAIETTFNFYAGRAKQ
jgi:hypothetical protein